MYRGFIRLWRCVDDNPIAIKPAYLSVWLFLVRNANHQKNEIIWNNKRTIIEKGSFITSSKKIARGTGVPESSVRRILEYLENEVMIEQQTNQRFRLISIINYEKYNPDERLSEQQMSNNLATNEQQMAPNNNVKELRRIKKNVESSELSSQVNQIMEIFSRINPTLSWGNKTIRNSASDFIKKFTLMEAKRMCEAIISVQGKPYAPRATNPYQAWTKLADFKFYFDGLKNKQKEVFKI